MVNVLAADSNRGSTRDAKDSALYEIMARALEIDDGNGDSDGNSQNYDDD